MTKKLATFDPPMCGYPERNELAVPAGIDNKKWRRKMNKPVKTNGEKKGLFALLMESMRKSNDGCGPGCGCHAADEKKADGRKVEVGGKKKK